MSRRNTLLFALALIICATPLYAGTLASDTSAYDDGVTHWFGSTPYANGNLVGSVEWAVYAPGTFPAAFSGFTPAPTSVVYAYQIFETGTDPLSLLTVAISGNAFPGGTFTGGGVSGQAPTTSTITAFTSASWTFAGIGAGQTSAGLAFESPNAPENSVGVVLNGGSAAGVVPIPGASPFLIPEPSTITLALFGLVGFLVMWLRRR